MPSNKAYAVIRRHRTHEAMQIIETTSHWVDRVVRGASINLDHENYYVIGETKKPVLGSRPRALARKKGKHAVRKTAKKRQKS